MSLLSSSSWMVGRLPPTGPNEIGFSPKPCGMIRATGAVPALTAASAVGAMYSGCWAPLTGTGRVRTTSEPSRSRPWTRRCEMRLRSSSTTRTLTLGVLSWRPPKMTAKMLKKTTGRMKLKTSAPRSRRRETMAVRTMAEINRATPFRLSVGRPIRGSVCVAKRREVRIQPSRKLRAGHQSRWDAQS
jgi:hypothetical protein